MIVLDSIILALIAASILLVGYTRIRYPLPRKRSNCPVGLFIDAVVRDANRK